MSNTSKKQQIIDTIKQYTENQIFDIATFRKENPKLYASLPYYFGGVNSLLEELGLVKVQKSQQKNKVTLRNRLAYDMLVELRKDNTLEQIANKYDVSRASINQLYQALELSIKVDDIKEIID